MYRRFLSLLTSIVLVAAALPLLGNARGNVVRAETVTDLYEATQKGPNGSFSVIIECNGNTLKDGDTINVGDTLVCTMDWAFPDNDFFQLNPGDSLTYTLPANVNFDDDGGPVFDKDKQVGTFSISGNLITITYTDDQFCANNKRIGNLAFYGSVEQDPNPDTDPDEITISFTGSQDLSLYIKAKETEKALEVDKVFHVEDNENHIYTCLIPITAVGDQTNIKVTDTMWPGMDLYGDPPALYSVYTDAEKTLYTDCTAFEHDGGADGRTFGGTIYHLADGQTVYLFYRVKVVDDMYDGAKGQKWAEENGWTGEGNFYDEGYPGVIPNRVTLTSDQVEKPVIRTTDIIGSGYNLIKWQAAPLLDSATGIQEDELGYIRWQLVVKPIKDTEELTITEVYVLDTLPENSSLDEGSLFLHDSHWNPLSIDDYLTYDYDAENGTVRFNLNSALITMLKTQSEGIYIEYRTHVDMQTDASHSYRNEATLYYNGDAWDNRAANYTVKRPAELDKTVLYDARRAPYAEYTIVVNPMAMDLDPNSTVLTLTDTLGSALDVDLSSILVNGESPDPDDVGFSVESNSFTLKLQDSTRYVITYKALINLAPDENPDALNSENSLNTCELVGVVTSGNQNEAELHSKVYRMSASSSSSISYGTYNIIKCDEKSSTHVLSGAAFEIASAEVKDGKVISTTTLDTKESGSDGKITFDELSRGTIYRFVEVDAPEGYELDDTPFFVVFAETSNSVYPSVVTYGEKDYPVQVIDFNRYSYNNYVTNAEETTVEPTDPTEPDPTEPTDTDPTDTDPTTPTDPQDPTDNDPTTPTDTQDPADTDPTTPTDTQDPTDTDPTTPTDPADTTDDTDPTEPAEPSSVGEDPTDPAESTQAPSDSAEAPAEPAQAPSETSTDIQNQGRGKDQDDSTKPDTTPSEPSSSDSSTSDSTTKASVNSTGRVVKTGEAVSTLAIIGGIMTIISFAAVLFLQKRDREEET